MRTWARVTRGCVRARRTASGRWMAAGRMGWAAAGGTARRAGM